MRPLRKTTRRTARHKRALKRSLTLLSAVEEGIFKDLETMDNTVSLTDTSAFWFGLSQALHEGAEHDLAWKIDDASEKARGRGIDREKITLNFTHDEIKFIFQMFVDRM